MKINGFVFFGGSSFQFDRFNSNNFFSKRDNQEK